MHPYCPIQILYKKTNLTHYVQTQELLVYKSLREKKNSSSIKRRPTHFLGIRCDKKTVSGVIEAFPADSPLYNCKVVDLAYSKLVSCTYDICDIK